MGYFLDLFDIFLDGYLNKVSRKAALSTLYHHVETAPIEVKNKKAGQVLVHTAASFISHHKKLIRPGFSTLSTRYRARLYEALTLLYHRP